MLLLGAFISAASPFVLCLGSSMPFQIAMILVLTVGEALWSPRLYEYNVAIAPRGREATYVSLAMLPYFLAKFLVGPTSGYLLDAFCPPAGPRQPALLWAVDRHEHHGRPGRDPAGKAVDGRGRPASARAGGVGQRAEEGEGLVEDPLQGAGQLVAVVQLDQPGRRRPGHEGGHVLERHRLVVAPARQRAGTFTFGKGG